MTRPLLVTPENWFDLARLAATVTAGTTEFMLCEAPGHCPLAEVSLGELRAVHHTFGSWWADPGADTGAASLPPGAWDRLRAEGRALLRQQAEAALASEASLADTTPVLLAFPALDHPWLSTSAGAAALLKQFLWLPHAPSLLAWAQRLAAADDAAAAARRHAWMRVLFQKVAVENELPEALACLRAVYDADDAARAALLRAEADMLDACGLTDLAAWGRRLGLHQPAREDVGLEVPARRPAPADARPDVTVLVPSYCHAPYIEAALESVLAQTYANYRLLVVDDRSTDGTVAQASRIDDPRVRIETNDTNLGLGDSVLRALERIDTPYVALLNSDDLFHPRRLERCLEALQQLPAAQVVATGVVTVDANGCRLTPETVRRLFDGRDVADWLEWHARTGQVAPDADLLAALLERNFLVTSSNLVARTAFLRGCAEALRGLKYCLDWQIFLEAAAAGALVYLPEALLGYRLHGANTVWFDDERGAAYALEVNRVLAHTLRHRAAHPLNGDADVPHLLELLTRHAAMHSDANGWAIYANDLVGGPRLEAARARSADVRAWLRVVSPRFDRAGRGPRSTNLDLHAVAAAALADVAKEEAAAASAAGQARDLLRRQQVERETIEERQRTRIATLEAAATVHADEVSRLRAEREAVAIAHAHELQQQHDDATAAAAAQAQAHAAELQRLRADMTVAAAAHASDRQRLHTSPEWLVGDRLWNRAGGSRVGWPLVRGWRRLRDRRNRASLALGRIARTAGLAKPRAVVAACWSFPIHSQTFVYQEMQALAWAGLDCKVFCCDTNARQELPAAFSGLWGKRLVMQTDWDANQRDLDHFLQTRPERVDALLATLGAATGLTREQLLNESIVRTGFTFARHVELSGARYLHTYFFYDQSLLGLIAAFLLQIPRGITAYADHMLGDYQFKLVPLHLELADIVVATSARIKRELGAIGGGRFDDKIIVKPNGIDAARFPYVDGPTRLAMEGLPELIAVNRIEPKKGLVHLVDALGLLKARGVDVTLNLVGGADKTPAGAECFRQLTARIDELGLGDRIILHGMKQQHEFIPLMARSRLFVAPYVEVDTGDKDGIPTAVLEAMSTGLPIVHTDAGSIEEAAADGVEGLTVPQRDAGALAEAIARLLSDRELYLRMSVAARQRALSEFDIHVTERRLHERIQALRATSRR